MYILTNFLYQLVFTVGIVAVFGLLIALARRLFVGLLGGAGAKTLLVTGFVGTPIHELSHALMCLVFFHKVEEIKLYTPNSDDGTLGYVNHSYNPKNIYHQIGNFFIGIAPILGGTAVLMLLMSLLAPDVHTAVSAEISATGLSRSLTSASTYTNYLGLIWSIIGLIFSTSNFSSVLWWVFIVLAIMIASHMELSGADIVGSLKGLGILAVILLIADAIVGLISKSALNSLTSFMTSGALYMLAFLGISFIFCLVMVVVALVLHIVFKRIL